MRNKYLFSLLIFTTALAFIYNFYIKVDREINSSEDFISDYYTFRKDMSIPEIGKDWKVIDGNNSDTTTWAKDRFVADSLPFHYYKEVVMMNDSIFSERDVFHYETNTDNAYRVSCTFLYGSMDVKCRYIKYFKGQYPPTTSFDVDIVFVDSLLNEWNLGKYYKVQRD